MTYIEKIINVENGKTLEREYTKAEIATVETAIAKAEAEAEAIAKAKLDKAAAQAKLAALGLTADDLKALGL